MAELPKEDWDKVAEAYDRAMAEARCPVCEEIIGLVREMLPNPDPRRGEGIWFYFKVKEILERHYGRIF